MPKLTRVVVRGAAKVFAWGAVSLVAVFLVLCTAGEIRQRILVHRGEKLLADIHSLRLHQSSWGDAQQLMARWGRWGHYDGTCTATDCFYVMRLESWSMYSNNVAEWPSRVQLLFSEFRWLPRQWGGGLRQLEGMFVVQDGLVVRSGLAIDMTVSWWAKGGQQPCCGDELILSAVSRGSLDGEWQDEETFARHPDYKVWRPGGCTFCLMGRVTYADSVSSQEAERLSNFQVTCATRWSSCLTLEELNPAARDWHLYGPPWGEAPAYVETPFNPAPYCHLPVYARARDAREVLLVEAMEDSQHMNDGGLEQTHIRPLAILKEPKIGSVQIDIIKTHGRQGPGDQIGQPVSLMSGKQYVLFVDDSEMPSSKEPLRPVPNLDPCAIEAWSPSVEKEVQGGRARTHSIRSFEPTISLEGFARHAPRPFDH